MNKIAWLSIIMIYSVINMNENKENHDVGNKLILDLK